MNQKPHIQNILKHLPAAPGVYYFISSTGQIMYIGKSKCLKKRVKSYFTADPAWEKAKRMAPLIDDIHFTVTDTHLDAMLLECEQIKREKPYFNSLMKNDQSYVYLTLEAVPGRNPLKITSDRAEFSYGPFRKKGLLQDIIDSMFHLYPLDFKDSVNISYHVIPRKMSEGEFFRNKEALHLFLSSHKECLRLIGALKASMNEAAREEHYERAARYRNLIINLEKFTDTMERFGEWDHRSIVYAVPVENRFKYFFIHNGQLLGTSFSDICSRESAFVFAQEAIKNLHSEDSETMDRKRQIDFRDILWNEISHAAPGYCFFLSDR